MMRPKKPVEIPRGNTCPGVNETIINYLLTLNEDFNGDVFFDIPCGEGDFLRSVKEFFPLSETIGADINLPANAPPGSFLQIDAQQELSLELKRKARVITCISGVMEFDNTVSFFGRLRENLDESSVLIVTNDNLLSVRDRVLYLLFGRFRQYRLFIRNNQPTWKIIPLQNLLRILDESGFEAVEIKYVPIKAAEWLWLPLAILIYISQILYLRFAETEIEYAEKVVRYPFLSLLSRHYIVVCRIKR